MSFGKLLAEDRRLVILRMLASAPGYAANGFVLREGLAASGHAVSQDQLSTELAWLAEQGLLTIVPVADMAVAHLSPRGADVAAGLAVVPGVKRPEPGVSDMMSLGLDLIRGKMGA